MKQLVFFIAIICSISILFASCSKDEETQTDAEKAEAAEAAAITAIGLNGTWKGACDSTSSGNYGAQSFVSSGTSFSANWSQYSDSECSTTISSSIDALKIDLGEAYTLADGNTAHKGVGTLVSKLLTYYTSTLVSAANTLSLCEKEWEINTAIDIAGLTCSGSEEDSAGLKTYFLYYINGTSLQFGTSSADNVTSLYAETYTKQ